MSEHSWVNTHHPDTQPSHHVVNSHTEWDPLEEVILGDPDGAHFPPWHVAVQSTMPEEHFDHLRSAGGTAFPTAIIDSAKVEIDQLRARLEAEGVKVCSPSKFDHSKAFETPYWRSISGLYSAMPRDVFLVIGNEIIEAPMAWRCRHFEACAYRELLMDYFRRGARWIAAPKPSLRDDQFVSIDDLGIEGDFIVRETEPTFDAADFLRCGRDIFVQQSHVTNMLGIEWLRRHLGVGYFVHKVEVNDPHPMHIDATMAFLAPGKLLANPERLPVIPPQLKDWDVRYAPRPSKNRKWPLYMSSDWISMNVFSLDRERVLVETQEVELAELLKDWGFEPIPVDFQAFNALGGSFHCATLDIRRKGEGGSFL